VVGSSVTTVNDVVVVLNSDGLRANRVVACPTARGSAGGGGFGAALQHRGDTNVAAEVMPAAEVIAKYHDLWHVGEAVSYVQERSSCPADVSLHPRCDRGPPDYRVHRPGRLALRSTADWHGHLQGRQAAAAAAQRDHYHQWHHSEGISRFGDPQLTPASPHNEKTRLTPDENREYAAVESGLPVSYSASSDQQQGCHVR
jgi:hypothetical protein